MKNRGLRVALVLLAVVALAGAGYFVSATEGQIASARNSLAAFERDAAGLHRSLADMRAAMPAYVAAGQNPAFWTTRNAELLQDLSARAKRLERPGILPATSQEIATVEEAAATLAQLDKRIHVLLQQESRGEASRMIFTDASGLSSAASEAVSQAVASESRAMDAAITRSRRLQAYALGGAALLTVAVLLLLLPAPPSATAQQADVELAAADAGVVASADSSRLFTTPLQLDSLGSSGFDLDIGTSTKPGAPRPVEQKAPEAAIKRLEATPPPASAPAAPAVDLAEAARLCTELAQVADTDQLRQLLGRAAALLNASGIVVWLGGVNGPRLRPAFSYGYSPQTLARMQAIGRDDENAVSAAYRTGKLQVVGAGEVGKSALAMPLLAPSGCVGAIAVELDQGAEKDSRLHALGQLVAAQIGTLMPTDA